MNGHPILGMWCCICNQHEPSLDTDYHRCFECGHVYRSAEELLAEFRAEGGSAETAAMVPGCPRCLHDF
jgi:hypothetical protein